SGVWANCPRSSCSLNHRLTPHVLPLTCEFQFADRRFVQGLNDRSVRIAKIKGITAIAVLFRLLQNAPAQLREARCNLPIHPVDCLRTLKNHADMIQQLPSQGLIGWKLGGGNLM